MSNIVITGIPRSGTTLTCHLLNMLPDTVALHEPMKIVGKEEFCSDHAILSERVRQFYAQTRHSLLTDGTAVTKQKGGKVPSNPRGGYSGPLKYLPNFMRGRSFFGRSITRPSIVTRSRITFDKPLSDNFTLCVKQNGGFVTLLSALTPHLRCYALIRNPLSVLASWNSLQINLYSGHMPTVERMTPDLRQDLSEIPERIDRQLHILDWFFRQLRANLPSENILRYEDVVSSQGKALKVISPHAAELAQPLENKNQNALYNRGVMRDLAQRLLQQDGEWWHFYKREEIEQLENAVMVRG